MVRFRLALLALLTAFAAVLLPAAPAQAALSVAGGDVLTSGAARCQLGFNLSGRGILAAPTCGPVGTQWFSGSDLIGVTVVQTQTAALIWISNPAVTQLAGRRIGGGAVAPVTAAGQPFVGQPVTFHSSTLGTRTGTVTALNQTVNYPTGSISGLVRTTLCAGPRDPGAPIVSGSVGLAIVFGGSGTCSSGSAVFAVPITPLLAAWGRTLY